jgi:hypothetical protein
MTLLISWIHGDDLILCADTAVTHYQVPGLPKNSFGQDQDLPSRTVEEGANKIAELPQSTLIGMAGNEKAVIQHAAELKRLLALGISPQEAFFSLKRTIKVDDAKFTLIVLDPHSVKLGLLGVRTTDDSKDLYKDNILVVGRLPDNEKEVLRSAVKSLVGSGISAEMAMMAMLVSLQSRSLSQNYLQFGVGGAFVGARTNKSGVCWQKEMLFSKPLIDLFARAPVVSLDDPPDDITRADSIRVSVHEGIATVLWAVGGTVYVKAFFPAFVDKQKSEVEAYMRSVNPNVGRACENNGLIHETSKSAIYATIGSNRRGAPIYVTEQDGVGIAYMKKELREFVIETTSAEFRLRIITEIDRCYYQRDFEIST